MATKLYVGNLSYSTNADQLKEVFSQAGEVVSATVLTDKITGRSRGFGFIEMADDAAAQKAIELFNGYKLDDRELTVNEARPMTERTNRGGGFGGGGPRRGGFGGGRGGYGGGGGYSGGNDRY